MPNRKMLGKQSAPFATPFDGDGGGASASQQRLADTLDAAVRQRQRNRNGLDAFRQRVEQAATASAHGNDDPYRLIAQAIRQLLRS